MSKQIDALKLALEALEECRRDPSLKYEHPAYDKAITAIKEVLAQPEQEMVSKARYNRMRDDYNDLLKQSQQDAKDAKEWRRHVTHCQLQGVDLDHNFAQPEQEPAVYVRKDALQKASRSAILSELTPEPRQDRVRIYTIPPQRKE